MVHNRHQLGFPIQAVTIRSICLALALTLSSSASGGVAENDIQSALERGDYEKAASLFRPLAEQGVAEAQFMLGRMYHDGQGVPQDHAEAFKWIRRAASQGIADAQYNLSVMYKQGLGVAQDDAEAVKWLQLAAEQAHVIHVIAQFILGGLYAEGDGVPQDTGKALKLYRLAAEQGLAEAHLSLGIMYDEGGKGVAEDDAEAVKWYRLWVDQTVVDVYQGGAGSDIRIARLRRQQVETQNRLGVMYRDGLGVARDFKEAAKWLREAADQGLAEAQFNLALMYYKGQGVPPNLTETVRWYRLAADQEHMQAQLNLGAMYLAGEGLPQDRATAIKWFRRALTGRVVDGANVLSAATERELTVQLKAHEDASTNQVVVVTLESLRGATIDEYGLRLGRAWGIGQAGKDNGVLLIVAPNDRKVRIEVGYGLEDVLTNTIASHIIQTQILPPFVENNLELGIRQGVDAIVHAVRVGRTVESPKDIEVQIIAPSMVKEGAPFLIQLYVRNSATRAQTLIKIGIAGSYLRGIDIVGTAPLKDNFSSVFYDRRISPGQERIVTLNGRGVLQGKYSGDIRICFNEEDSCLGYRVLTTVVE